MTIWKWLWRSAVTAITLTVLSITVLLVYYRPTIEYAYVDIIDKHERPAPGWQIAILGVVVALPLVAALAWLKRKANQRG